MRERTRVQNPNEGDWKVFMPRDRIGRGGRPDDIYLPVKHLAARPNFVAELCAPPVAHFRVCSER